MNGQIGPHEGRELALLRQGTKPLACFTGLEAEGGAFAFLDEDELAALVAEGLVVTEEAWSEARGPDGAAHRLHHLYVARAGEAWRIPALRMIEAIYGQGPGWRPDLERVIGALLGYGEAEVEAFLRRVGGEG
ncbi:hypothetical protein [Zavarzinia compransoris]|uniref:Hemin receptor n=1 Tax=Zavarzinia compransoris TaxID=1264899 RepID=A0A317EFH6_9PROT|nr:hypothetical protein [Zavarzinia compransoris]PWR23935.1 hypothetical protein DKG75_05135 [Zavarzinia compransoris]TDP48182.1 hypothetical protein DES42_102485 [Zavarzinia compransoris]